MYASNFRIDRMNFGADAFLHPMRSLNSLETYFRYIIKSVNQHPWKFAAWKPEALLVIIVWDWSDWKGEGCIARTTFGFIQIYSYSPPLSPGFRYSSSNGEPSWRQMFSGFQPSGLCLLRIEIFIILACLSRNYLAEHTSLRKKLLYFYGIIILIIKFGRQRKCLCKYFEIKNKLVPIL